MAKGDSEYVDLIVVFITDNIRIIEIEFVLSISWTFNYYERIFMRKRQNCEIQN